MGNDRSRQVRLEKKHRRREKRRRAKQDGAGDNAELKYAVRLVLSSEGKEPDPRRLAEIPKTLMSDALVELVRPYISWPPAANELDELEAWLRLGADVWNVTVEAKDSAACMRQLARLAAGLDEEDSLSLVQEIAHRKFARFASDPRRVKDVRVVERDGRATVEAASLARVPGVPR
jgi:hypothetical protein